MLPKRYAEMRRLAWLSLDREEGAQYYAAMNLMGLPGGGFPRAPLRPLDGTALAGLEAGLDRILATRAKVA